MELKYQFLNITRFSDQVAWENIYFYAAGSQVKNKNFPESMQEQVNAKRRHRSGSEYLFITLRSHTDTTASQSVKNTNSNKKWDYENFTADK